jgi:hypothetical protein
MDEDMTLLAEVTAAENAAETGATMRAKALPAP